MLLTKRISCRTSFNNKICSPTLILRKAVFEEIYEVFYSIQHWKHTWKKKTEYDREIQLEKLKREHQFTLIKRHAPRCTLLSEFGLVTKQKKAGTLTPNRYVLHVSHVAMRAGKSCLKMKTRHTAFIFDK